MRTPFTPAHAKALTVLVLAIRPEWSKNYTEDAIGRMRLIDDDLERICRVAVNAALNPKIRKPDVLAMNGEHWKARVDDGPIEPERSRMCVVCGTFHKPTERCSGAVVITRSTAEHVAAARLAVNGKRVKTYTPRPITDTPLPEEDA
jgi:hypothetical protein